MTNKQFARWFRERRHWHGISQFRCAAILGVSRSYIAKIETGRESPMRMSLSISERMARSLFYISLSEYFDTVAK